MYVSSPAGLRARAPSMFATLGVLSLALLLALAGCDKAGKSSSLAKANFPDSPLMAYVPADTPYVFASFQPVPESYWKRFMPMMKAWTSNPAMRENMAKGPGGPIFSALADELAGFDAKKAADLGISLQARVAVYGMGVYPVFRMEIADGDRLYAAVQRVATKAGTPLGAPTERDGRRYWAKAEPGQPGGVIAIAAHEVVFAVTPEGELDKRLPEILGIQKPGKALATEKLRELVRSYGFSAYGIGFADSHRIAELTIPATATAECKKSILDLTARAPRFVMGYGDLNQPVLEFGFIVELAKDLIPDLKASGRDLPPVDLATSPLFAMSVAADLGKLRAQLGRFGAAMSAIGTACQSTEVTEFAGNVNQAATAPLPPALTGIRGAVLVVQDVVLGGAGGAPKSVDGYAAVYADDAPALFKTITSMVPPLASLDLKPDGAPHDVLAGALPFPVKAAMRPTGVAVYSGDIGAKSAQAALSAKPTHAPLVMFHYDYGRLFALIGAAGGNDPSTAALKDLGKGIGPLTMDVSADDRGLVTWMKMRFNEQQP